MPIDFPNSPTVSQSFTAGGSTWIWDGIAWTLQRITTGAQGIPGIQGTQGPEGPVGPQGTSINVKASVATVALLPATGNAANDARIVQSDGDLYIWGGTSWTSAGQIVGPEGTQGIQGIQGIQGLTGAPGTNGTNGAPGTNGTNGAAGTNGTNGAPGATGASGGITLSVTNAGSGSYTINGSANPTLSFIRGHRYVINVSASGHPFWIQTVSGAFSAGNVYSTGVTLSSGTRDNGTIIFEVPFNAPQLYYACEYHSSMAGSITVSNLGPTGLTGTNGTNGAPGAPGASATISVATTTTLVAGSAASVTNTGTAAAAILNFGIPQGPAGETFPTQINNSGKFLSTNGASTLWSAITQYSLPAQLNNSGKFLTTNGSSESWVAVTTTPAAGSITNAMLANSSISINSSPVALGANINLATTAYSNGTNTANSNKIFYNSSGVQPTGTAAGDLYIFF